MSNDFRNEQRSTTLEAPPSALSTATNLQNQTTSPSEEMSKGYVKPLIAELIGTFVFGFIGAGSIITNTLTHGAIGLRRLALAHGLALAVLITLLAAISGRPLNPAVTI